MIKVLHLRSTDKICGPGKTIIETLAHIDGEKFDLRIGLFTLKKEAGNQYYDEVLRRGFPIQVFRSAFSLDPRIFGQVARYTKSEGIHILHSHDYLTDLVAFTISRMLPVTIVTTQHGWIRNRKRSRIYITLQGKVLPRFRKVIAVSGKMRDDLIALGIPADIIQLIYNGIVLDKYIPNPNRKNALREKYNLASDAPLIGCIGRLSPEKGQRDFIEAARLLSGKHPDACYFLVGDGPDRETLERQVEVAGIENRVFFTGHLNDVRSIYNDLDILALTSYTEGMPNVVLESMCMETPVVATRVGGVGEIVRDGITGILVDSGNPEQVAAGIGSLLLQPDLRQSIVQNARAAVRKQHDFRERTHAMEALYRSMINRQ